MKSSKSLLHSSWDPAKKKKQPFCAYNTIQCPCSLCKKKGLVSFDPPPQKYETSLSKQDYETRSELHKKFLKKEDDRDLMFILRRLLNNKNSKGNMVILITPVAFYKNGSAMVYIKMGGKRAFCTPKFIAKGEKLSNNDMGKYFFEKLPFLYFKEKKRVDKKNYGRKKNFILEKKISFKRFEEMQKKMSVKHGNARKEKNLNQVFVRMRPEEFKIEIINRKQFNRMMQMNKSNKQLQNLSIIQKGVFMDENLKINVHRSRFKLEK